MNEYFQLAIAFAVLSIALFYLASVLNRRAKRRYADEMVDREVKKWEAETAEKRAAGFPFN